MSKKTNIRKYLEAIGQDNHSTFRRLLSDYLDGKLSTKLQQIGLDKPEITIDFLEEYKCINIQGKCKRNYVDIQIEETEFSIGCDPIEPDDHEYYPLEDYDSFFATVSQKLDVL